MRAQVLEVLRTFQVRAWHARTCTPLACATCILSRAWHAPRTFQALAGLPPESMGAYCISMAHYASDVLAVRLLQVKSGVKTPMRVSPLFETREDLQNAPA